MAESEIVLLPLLFLALIYEGRQMIIAARIAKSKVIENYINNIHLGSFRKIIPSNKEIIVIQKRLRIEYGGKYFNRLLIRQAFALARMARKKGLKMVHQIDLMNQTDFERFLKNIFENRGYQVKFTPSSGNKGVDLILYKEDRKIAVQAIRYNQNKLVGNYTIQEVNTGKTYYDCKECWVITSSFFTKKAISLAHQFQVQLIDRNMLVKLLQTKKAEELNI